MARGAFGLAADSSRSKEGVFLNQPSPGRGCSTAQGRSQKGGRSEGSGSISHLACLGNAGRGWGQIGREPPESSKPGITQGLREHRKNNPDDILKHNYPACPAPLPPQACCDYTRRLGSRAPTLAPWHLHKERSPAEIIPIYNSSATTFLQTAEVVCTPHAHHPRPPAPARLPKSQRLSDPEEPKEPLLFLLCHVPDTVQAKNTLNRVAAHLERCSELLHVPPSLPSPKLPTTARASSGLLLGRGAELQRGSGNPGESVHQGIVTGPLQSPWRPLAGSLQCLRARVMGDPSVGCGQGCSSLQRSLGSHPGLPEHRGTRQPPAAPGPGRPPVSSTAPVITLYNVGF